MSAGYGPLTSVTIVGASLAGISTARALRAAGFDGTVTILGAEGHRPYDRPPLSKDLLADRSTIADLRLLPDEQDLGLDLRLGCRATELLAAQRAVRTTDGQLIQSSAVVIATGAHARTLPIRAPARGVHVLRTLDDAIALGEALRAAQRLLVVGGGFIGCEVASTARALGLDVTLIEAAPLPLGAALGPQIADRMLRLAREHGVQAECGVALAEIVGHQAVTGVRLTSGRFLAADVVLVAVGATPDTAWLRGSGITLAPDGGVCCDAACRTSIPRVVAAGDLAHAPHAFLGGPARIEHWTSALEQGGIAAATLLGRDHVANGSAAPYFWSDLWGGRLQVAGRPGPADALRIIDGDPESDLRPPGGFAGAFERRGPTGTVATAVVAFNRPRVFAKARRSLQEAPATTPVGSPPGLLSTPA